jgi:hypothetical protein
LFCQLYGAFDLLFAKSYASSHNIHPLKNAVKIVSPAKGQQALCFQGLIPLQQQVEPSESKNILVLQVTMIVVHLDFKATT